MAIYDDEKDLRRRDPLADRPVDPSRDPAGDIHRPADPRYEERRGMSWAWLLLPLALILLIFLFWRPADRPVDPDAPAVGTTGMDPATRPEAGAVGAPMGEPITDPAVVHEAADPMELAGRHVEFRDVTIEAQAGERAFWIATAQGERLLVVADRVDTLPAEGESATVIGTVQPLHDADQAAQWGLSAEEAQRAQQTGVYVQADEVTAGEAADREPAPAY